VRIDVEKPTQAQFFPLYVPQTDIDLLTHIYKKTSKPTYAAIFLKPLSVLAQWVIYIYIYIYIYIHLCSRI